MDFYKHHSNKRVNSSEKTTEINSTSLVDESKKDLMDSEVENLESQTEQFKSDVSEIKDLKFNKDKGPRCLGWGYCFFLGLVVFLVVVGMVDILFSCMIAMKEGSYELYPFQDGSYLAKNGDGIEVNVVENNIVYNYAIASANVVQSANGVYALNKVCSFEIRDFGVKCEDFLVLPTDVYYELLEVVSLND